MNSIDDLLANLFVSLKAGGLFLSEPLERSRRFYIEYDKRTMRTAKLAKAVAFSIAGREQLSEEYETEMMRSDYANGFIVWRNERIHSKDFIFLFEYFYERVLSLQYKRNAADRKIYLRENYIETIERYYLKPAVNQTGVIKPVPQRYGNVLIELINRDDKPFYIKLLVTTYSGFDYEKPLPFDDFLQKIFEA
jgi:hypothetical protein